MTSQPFQQLHEIIHQIEEVWPTKRFLVLGDVMLDKYVWGEVLRISPEAPVPVVRSIHRSHQPGGAANVAMNIAKLGAEVTLVGFTGGDEDEQLLTQVLLSNQVNPAFISSEDFPTITKLHVVGGRQQMLRLDSENLSPRPARDQGKLCTKALDELHNCHAVILSDYAKGALLPSTSRSIIAAARKLGRPVLVDPAIPNFTRYRGATTICSNLQELSVASHTNIHDLEAVLTKAERMLHEFDLEHLTATLSGEGIAVVSRGRRFTAPTVTRQVFDVSGADDTVISVLALCSVSGLPMEASVQLANIAAGIVVSKMGTVPIEKYELLTALAPNIALQGEEKVLTLDKLLRRIAAWRANGEHIVFTNGCFDLLHTGHIALLEQSRQHGERLIVAINSDVSVSCIKGPTRPIIDQGARARVLAALASVDAVIVFDMPTPLELIMTLRPDVITKGGDHSATSIVGAREVRSWGGEVKILPLVEGQSTTRLIERSLADTTPIIANLPVL